MSNITSSITTYQITSDFIFPPTSPLILNREAKREDVADFELSLETEEAVVAAGLPVGDTEGSVPVSVIFPVFWSKQTVTCLQIVDAPSTLPVSSSGLDATAEADSGVGVGAEAFTVPDVTFMLQLD